MIISDVFTEVAVITEHVNKNVSLMLSEPFFKKYKNGQQQRIIHALYVLAKNKLSHDMTLAPIEETIPISGDDNHNDFVAVIKLLVNDNADFEMLSYFGGQANPETSLQEGIQHLGEIIETLQLQMAD